VREVVVEHIGGKTRTIRVGREKKKKRTESFRDVVCSPRILGRVGTDTESPRKSRCWKTTKNGESHATRGWQRHPGRQPSRRRNRWGRVRKYNCPSAKILNELRIVYDEEAARLGARWAGISGS
jgi:hypothetical protein